MRTLLPFSGLLFVGVSVGLGQAAPEPAPTPLEPVLVEDRPIAIGGTLDAFGTLGSVLSRTQLDALGPVDLAGALRRTPGATTTTYNRVGAFGGTEGGAVILRGLGSSRPGSEIKTLFDGVPLLNGVFNHPLLDLVPVDAAESIRVHHRASPLTVGNALGAIELTPLRLSEDGVRGRAEVSGGTDATFGARLHHAQRAGAFDLGFAHASRRSDGHRPDADGRTASTYARLAARPGPGWEVGWMTLRTDNRGSDPGAVGVPPGPPSTRGERYLTDGWLHSLRLSHDHGPVSGSLRLHHASGSGDWLRRAYSGQPNSLNDWRQRGGRWQGIWEIDDATQVLAAADVEQLRGRTESVFAPPAPSPVFGPESFRLASTAIGVSRRMGGDGRRERPWTVSAGARAYDHSVFGRSLAPQVSASWSGGASTLHAGYSRGISHPGLEVAALAVVANPALGQSWRRLSPERAHQIEAGWTHVWTRGVRSSVVVFANDVRDRYVIVPPPPPPPRFASLERTRTRGAEASLDWRPAPEFGLYAAVSTLRVSPGDLPYAPDYSGALGASWTPTRDWRLAFDVQAVGPHTIGSQARTAGAINAARTGGYSLVNVRASRRFDLGRGAGRVAEVWLAVENLLDRDYAHRPGYPMPGVSPTVGLALSW